MLAICKDQNKQEISRFKFLAIMCVDTTDISEKNQIVIIFRYEIDGKVFERLLGFFNPENQSAQELSRFLLNELQFLLGDDCSKLIAQCYDGAATLSGVRNGMQAILKRTYPNAHFAHCYAHKLNWIQQKATSANTKVRVFFNSLSGIPDFF